MTTPTTTELASIRMALHHRLSLRGLHQVEVFTDSRCPLKLLLNDEHTFLVVSEVGNSYRVMEDAGCSLSFHWIPSHSSIPGNDRADALTAAAHL